jgi:thioester reductase-like protein
MKVLLTGATGTIGGGALSACLTHPQITKVIAFVRRTLPDDISSNPKLETIIIEDFSTWSDDLLDQHMDAAAMIW